MVDEGFSGGAGLLVGLMGECVHVGLVDEDVVVMEDDVVLVEVDFLLVKVGVLVSVSILSFSVSNHCLHVHLIILVREEEEVLMVGDSRLMNDQL